MRRIALAIALGATLATTSFPALAIEGATPLDLIITVDGAVATTPPGPEIEAGRTVTVGYDLVNSSDQWLWSAYLYQDGVGRITCPERHIAPRSTVTCTATITARSGDQSAGVFVTAWPEIGDGVEDSETLHYRGVDPPPSDLVNLALGRPATESMSAGYTGATPADRAVDGNTDGDSAHGSVAITYRVTDAWWEVDLGSVADIDHVVLWNRTDCCSDRLRRYHLFVSDVPFDVKDLKNTSTQAGVLDVFQPGAAGQSVRIPIHRTGRYVRVQLDYVDAVLQLAEVQVMGRRGVTPPAAQAPPTISLEASIGGDLADTAPGPSLVPGDTVTVDYVVTNTSNRTLWAVYLYHEGIGRVTCPQRNLAAGASVSCSATATVTGGSHAALVTVQAWDDAGEEAGASDPVHYQGVAAAGVTGPALEMEASVGDDAADDPPGPELVFGAPVTFRYVITNTGTEELWALYVQHDGVGPVACPVTHLLPGEGVTCEATSTVKAGDHAFQVAASAWDATGARASVVDPVHYHSTVAAAASIDMTVRVNDQAAGVAPGPTVALGTTTGLRFHVTNTGGQELWGLWISLPGTGTVPCTERHLLPGSAVDCTLDLPAQAGAHTYTARAVTYDRSGAETDVQTRFHYYVPQSTGAGAKLEFLVDGLNGDAPAGPRFALGEVLTFSYIVSNVGGVPLTNVRVADDREGVIVCPSTVVAPGETMVCKRTWEARLIETSNLATVTADGGVSDTERLYYHVRDYGREDQLTFVVTINGIDANSPTGPTLPVGSTATIRYVLTNRARTTLWNAEIFDPRVAPGQMQCSGGPTLGVGQSRVCTATITITQGQWSNLVIGHAWSSNGPRIDASDKVHYYGMP